MPATRRPKSRPQSAAPAVEPTLYDLTWQYEPRLIAEHFGRSKYAASTTALGELVANSLDAEAVLVDVDLKVNDLGGTESIRVKDDGCGMTPAELKTRFASVGVAPLDPSSAARLGRFGPDRARQPEPSRRVEGAFGLPRLG